MDFLIYGQKSSFCPDHHDAAILRPTSYRVMVKLRNTDLQPLEVLPLGLRIFTNIIENASEAKKKILMVRILQKQDYDLWQPHGWDSGCLQ